MSEPHPELNPRKVVSLPQTRRLSWTYVALEFTHQLVVSLWVGGWAAAGLLAGPSLAATLDNPADAAWAWLQLVLRLSFLATGAGGFLLLTTLLMHLLSLRDVRLTMTQTVLLLLMTFASLGIYLGIAPAMEQLLQQRSDLFDATSEAHTRFVRFHHWALWGVGLEVVLGALLLLIGVRRWYRYVTPPRRASFEPGS